MRRADHSRQLCKIAKIPLITQRQVLLNAWGLGKAGLDSARQGKTANDHHDGDCPLLDLLIHERSFARLADEFKARATEIRPIIMDDTGSFKTVDSEPIEGIPPLDLGYGTQDAYFSPAVMTFMQAILSAEKLQWFQSSAAGIEHPILQAIRNRADRYTSAHEQSPAIAEWILWAGLDWFQGGAVRRKAQSEKIWHRGEFRELVDTHWIIVGFGSIGRACAQRLKMLGAKVTGVRRTPGSDPDADTMIQPAGLRAALPNADCVVLCCPLTSETERMADGSFFKDIKEGALFINVGRGQLVDEEALLAGLDLQRPGHAALDVTAVEPLPEESPLWQHPQVTLTAHIAAFTERSARRSDRVFVENLDHFLSGEPLRNLVSKDQES